MQNFEKLIDKLHLEDLRNEIHPSFFHENDGYNMLILRLPVIEDTLQVKSTGFILTSEKSYLYNKSKNLFEDFEDRFEGPYKFIDKILDNFLKSFTVYQDTIADLEEFMYEDNITNDFMKKWFDLKRDIVRIERVMLRSSSVMAEVIKFYEKEEAFPTNKYVDLHEHMERTMRSAGLQLSKLDHLYSFYTARTNDKMNKMIYLLTIISAVFLPLNLLVGFFGMNTSGLPFVEGSAGTFKALSVMGVLFVITSFVFYLWNRNTDKNV